MVAVELKTCKRCNSAEAVCSYVTRVQKTHFKA